MPETMTAPAPAAQAPSVPQIIDQSAPATIPLAAPERSFNDTIQALALKTNVAAAPAVDTPSVRFARNTPAGADAPGSHDLPPGSTPPADVPDPVAAGEPTSELSIDDGDVLLSSQRNPDGTFKTKLDPNEKVDLVIKSVIDPETGKPKVYSKSLPELARLAKDGITLQQTVQKVQGELKAVQPEVDYYRAEVPKWQTHVQSLREQLDQQMALNRELLSADDEIVIQHRDRYRQEMSPEKQLERLRAERAAEVADRQKSEQQQQAEARRARHEGVATSFAQSRIAPSLQAAEVAGLSPYAVTGLVTTITNDLMVNGVIPPANWPEMERRITAPDGPFQTEVRQEQARRAKDTGDVQAAREAAERLQRQAQAVVNTDGRLMAPIGRAGADSAPTLPKPRNVQEVKDRLINRPLPVSMGASG